MCRIAPLGSLEEAALCEGLAASRMDGLNEAALRPDETVLSDFAVCQVLVWTMIVLVPTFNEEKDAYALR